MITAEFRKNGQGNITGFRFSGHADYAEAGYDIICAAVSALSLNTVNSIEELLKEPIRYEVQEDGFLQCEVLHPDHPGVQLLFESLLLGIRSIQKSYGKQFLRHVFVSANSST